METIEGTWAHHEPPTRRKPYWVLHIRVDGQTRARVRVDGADYHRAIVEGGGVDSSTPPRVVCAVRRVTHSELYGYRAHSVQLIQPNGGSHDDR